MAEQARIAQDDAAHLRLRLDAALFWEGEVSELQHKLALAKEYCEWPLAEVGRLTAILESGEGEAVSEAPVEEDQIDQATQADRSCSTNVFNHTVGDDQEVERLKRELVIAEQRAAQAEQEGRAAKAQAQVYVTQLVAFKAESDQLKLQLHAALEASDKRKAEVKGLHRALTSRPCHRPPHQSSRVSFSMTARSIGSHHIPLLALPWVFFHGSPIHREAVFSQSRWSTTCWAWSICSCGRFVSWGTSELSGGSVSFPPSRVDSWGLVRWPWGGL
ncbi:hypothetical protein FA13DRAFT_708192 [Coprinellus micaceus]|uniref:Uncharacterized protein n=1 Tax=Coprinellus micaceus TaxID=71717 RepID=A0A4Y7TUE4_COPMI|nr:hypothetical protein FA13DRAFT_708192 [Coprinellus micaceus]